MVKITLFTGFLPKKVFLWNRENGQYSGVVAPEVKGLEIFYRYEKCSKCFVESNKRGFEHSKWFETRFSRLLNFGRKKSFFDFSAEISAWGSKFLHFGGAHPFLALFLKLFGKFGKFRTFYIPWSFWEVKISLIFGALKNARNFHFPPKLELFSHLHEGVTSLTDASFQYFHRIWEDVRFKAVLIRVWNAPKHKLLSCFHQGVKHFVQEARLSLQTFLSDHITISFCHLGNSSRTSLCKLTEI